MNGCIGWNVRRLQCQLAAMPAQLDDGQTVKALRPEKLRTCWRGAPAVLPAVVITHTGRQAVVIVLHFDTSQGYAPRGGMAVIGRIGLATLKHRLPI